MRLVLNTFGPVPEFSGEIEEKINQVNMELINAVTFRTKNVTSYFNIYIISVYCITCVSVYFEQKDQYRMHVSPFSKHFDIHQEKVI